MSTFFFILGAIENGFSVVKLNLPHINVISYPSREPYAIFFCKRLNFLRVGQNRKFAIFIWGQLFILLFFGASKCL